MAKYPKRGNFHWAKLSQYPQYPQYMDFHGNTFTVQGQGPVYVYTWSKDLLEKLSRFSERPQKPQKFSAVKLSPFTVASCLVVAII